MKYTLVNAALFFIPATAFCQHPLLSEMQEHRQKYGASYEVLGVHGPTEVRIENGTDRDVLLVVPSTDGMHEKTVIFLHQTDDAGTYEYTTAIGGSRTIPKWKLSSHGSLFAAPIMKKQQERRWQIDGDRVEGKLVDLRQFPLLHKNKLGDFFQVPGWEIAIEIDGEKKTYSPDQLHKTDGKYIERVADKAIKEINAITEKAKKK